MKTIQFREAQTAVTLRDAADEALARRIVDAADEGGTIQGEDMVRLFPSRPRLHTATDMREALALLGEVSDC